MLTTPIGRKRKTVSSTTTPAIRQYSSTNHQRPKTSNLSSTLKQRSASAVKSIPSAAVASHKKATMTIDIDSDHSGSDCSSASSTSSSFHNLNSPLLSDSSISSPATSPSLRSRKHHILPTSHCKNQDQSMHSKPSSKKPTTLRNTARKNASADLSIDRNQTKRQCVRKLNQPICGGCPRSVEPQDPMVTCYTCLVRFHGTCVSSKALAKPRFICTACKPQKKKTPVKKTGSHYDSSLLSATPANKKESTGGKGKGKSYGTIIAAASPELDLLDDDICPVCDGECTCNPTVTPQPSIPTTSRQFFGEKTLAAIKNAVSADQSFMDHKHYLSSHRSSSTKSCKNNPPSKSSKNEGKDDSLTLSAAPLVHKTESIADEEPAIDFFDLKSCVPTSAGLQPTCNREDTRADTIPTALNPYSEKFADLETISTIFEDASDATVTTDSDAQSELDDETLDLFASLDSSDDELIIVAKQEVDQSHDIVTSSSEELESESDNDLLDVDSDSSDDMEVYEEPDDDTDDHQAEEEIVNELVQGNLINGWISSDDEESEDSAEFELFTSPDVQKIANAYALSEPSYAEFNLDALPAISDSDEIDLVATLDETAAGCLESRTEPPRLKIESDDLEAKDIEHSIKEEYMSISDTVIPHSELFDEELIDEAEVASGCSQSTQGIAAFGDSASGNVLNPKSFAFDIRKSYIGPNGEIRTSTKSITLQVPEQTPAQIATAANAGKRKGKRKNNVSSLNGAKSTSASAADTAAALALAIGPFPTKRPNQPIFAHPGKPLAQAAPNTPSNPWLTLAALKASALTSIQQNAANAANAAANKLTPGSDSKAPMQSNMQITSALTAALASSLLKHGNLNMSTIAAAAAAMVSNPAALLAFSELRKREMDSFQTKIKAAAQAAVAAAAAASPFYRAMDGSLKLKQQDTSASASTNLRGTGSASANPLPKNIEDLVAMMHLPQNGTATEQHADSSSSASTSTHSVMSPPTASLSTSIPDTPKLNDSQDLTLNSILLDDIMDSDRLDSGNDEDPTSCSEFEMDMIANGRSNAGLSRWKKIPISTFWHSQRRIRKERQRLNSSMVNKLSPGVKSPLLKATLFDRRHRVAPLRRHLAMRRESDAASMFLVSPVLVPTGYEEYVKPVLEDPRTFEDIPGMSTLPPLSI